MPIYSVTSVSQLITARSKMEKPAPELPEAVEDGLGVTALRHRAQADGHLLHIIRHRTRMINAHSRLNPVLEPVCA